MSSFTPLRAAGLRVIDLRAGGSPASVGVNLRFIDTFLRPKPSSVRAAQHGPVPLKRGSWFRLSSQWSNLQRPLVLTPPLSFKQLSHLVISHAFQIPP